MSCKTGPPLSQRCGRGMAPALCSSIDAFSDKPLIHSSRDLRVRANSYITEVPPENRRDVAAHGFRITDTDALTNRNRDPLKVLAAHEKEKKDKVLEDCLARLITSPH